MDITERFLSIARELGGAEVDRCSVQPPQVSQFHLEATAIFDGIMAERRLLRDRVVEYLGLTRHSRRSSEALTDAERDQLDTQVMNNARNWAARIDALRACIPGHATQASGIHQLRHRETVIMMLYESLGEGASTVHAQRRRRLQRKAAAVSRRIQAAEPLLATAHVHSAPDAHPAPEEDGDLDDQDMTEEERALLQEENHALLQRLQTEMDEVRALERNLAEVSTLITAMTSRITEQQVSIDRLHDSAVMSSENMKAATKHLQQATERLSELRLFIMVFLLGASFILLGLDWYS